MSIKMALFSAAILFGLASSAGATPVDPPYEFQGTTQNGTDCDTNNLASCSYNGSPLIFRYDFVTQTPYFNTSVFPNLFATVTINTPQPYYGTWGYDGNVKVTSFIVGAYNGFDAFVMDVPGYLFSNIGWSTNFGTLIDENGRPNPAAAYISLYDTGASPVPVPAALPLLASGLGALGYAGWRRQKKIKLAA